MKMVIRSKRFVRIVFLIAAGLSVVVLGIALSKYAHGLANPVIPTKYYATPPDLFADNIATLQVLATADPEHFGPRLNFAAKDATAVALGRLHTPPTPLPSEIIDATLQSIQQERPTGILDFAPYTSHTFREKNA
jgi:hypothetical protein